MFLRIVSDSFTRKPRRKVLTAAALALGMAVATATLEVALDVGDRLAREFRSLGANLLVTPASDTLPLEIGGVDYRPVDAGAYLPEGDLGKLKTIFWRNNVDGICAVSRRARGDRLRWFAAEIRSEELIGTWYSHSVPVPDGSTFTTGISATDPWWHIDGRWFSDASEEGVAGADSCAAIEFARRERGQNRCGRPLAHAYDHGNRFDRRPRRQRDPRAFGNRAGPGRPPRRVPALCW